MYNDHHTRVLAKSFLAQTLAVMVGLREAGQPTIRVSALERNDRRWLKVIRTLEDDGYVKVDEAVSGADPQLVITDKIFSETEAEEYVGQVRVGSPREPIAMWLSTGILRACVDDMLAGKAGVTVDDKGHRRLERTEDSAGAKSFSNWLCSELGPLARKHTDIGKSAAQDLCVQSLGNVQPQASAVAFALDGYMADKLGQLERLKREVDAIEALRSAIHRSGGWQHFLAAVMKDYKGRDAQGE